MKKTVSWILVLVLCLGLCACAPAETEVLTENKLGDAVETDILRITLTKAQLAIKLNASLSEALLDGLSKLADGFEREFYIIRRIEVEHTFIYDVLEAELSADGNIDITRDSYDSYNQIYGNGGNVKVIAGGDLKIINSYCLWIYFVRH